MKKIESHTYVSIFTITTRPTITGAAAAATTTSTTINIFKPTSTTGA